MIRRPASFILLFVLLLVFPISAGEATQVGRLELIGQTPFVAADGFLGTTLAWSGPTTEDVTISATVWAPLDREADVFAEPSEVRSRGPVLPLQDVPRTSAGDLDYTIPIRSFRASDQDDRIWIESSGVYPVTIEIRNQTGLLDTLKTNLIRLPTDIADQPLSPMAIILNVSSADGIDLHEAVDLLNNHPTLPFTVLLEDGLLPQLESNSTLTTSFSDSLRGRTVIAGTQLDLDPSALAQIDQPEAYLLGLQETRRRFSELGVELDPSIVPLDTGVTAEGVELLTSLGIQIVIDQHASFASHGLISSSAGDLRILRLDDDYAADLAVSGRSTRNNGTAVQRSHHLLASLAVRYQTDGSPVILGGSGLRNVDLVALEIILGALDAGGMMEAVPIHQAAEGTAIFPFLPQENPDQNLANVAIQLDSVQASLETYSQFRIAGGPAPAAIRLRLLEGLSLDLNPDSRLDAIESVRADLEDEFGVISLPDSPATTLAARKSAIPLTITNSSSGSRLVLIRFQSDRIKVDENDQEFLVEPGRSQIMVNVEARSLGVSTLLVTVLTPDGSVELASTKFQIRSTAIPGLGYALSGTALFMLVVWWIRSIKRSRRLSKDDQEDRSDDSSPKTVEQ